MVKSSKKASTEELVDKLADAILNSDSILDFALERDMNEDNSWTFDVEASMGNIIERVPNAQAMQEYVNELQMETPDPVTVDQATYEAVMAKIQAHLDSENASINDNGPSDSTTASAKTALDFTKMKQLVDAIRKNKRPEFSGKSVEEVAAQDATDVLAKTLPWAARFVPKIKPYVDQFYTGQIDENTMIEGLEKNITASAYKKYADYYEDVLQKVLNEIHDGWNGNESVKEIFDRQPEAKKFAFAFAKLNYQVGNGGFMQWIYNGYAGDTGNYLMEKLPTEGELGKVRGLLEEVADALGIDDWEDASDALEKAQGGDSDESGRWQEFLETDMGYNLKNSFNNLDIDTSDYHNAFDVNFEIDGKQFSGEISQVISEIDDLITNTDDDELLDKLEKYAEELEMLKEAEDAWGTYEGEKDDTVINALNKCDSKYYALDEETLYKAVADFIEAEIGFTTEAGQPVKSSSLKRRMAALEEKMMIAADNEDALQIDIIAAKLAKLAAEENQVEDNMTTVVETLGARIKDLEAENARMKEELDSLKNENPLPDVDAPVDVPPPDLDMPPIDDSSSEGPTPVEEDEE